MSIDKLDTIGIEDYVKVICAMMDIPVGKEANSYVQSLHLLFEVYSAFKSSQHFN